MGEWAGYIKNSTNKKYQAVKHVSNHRFSKCKNRNAHRVGHLFRKCQYIPVLRRPNDFVAYSALLPPPKWRC